MMMGPKGFWGSGENGYFFSGSWRTLEIIIGDLGSRLIVFVDLGSQAKKKKINFKNIILKENLHFV